jgi:hypothetical protein
MYPLVRQVTELRDGSALGPDDLDIGSLMPVFVPSSFVEDGAWRGPYELLRAAGIALAWAVILPGDTIRYVLDDMQRHWEEQGIDWKARALQNLRDLSPEPPGTGALFRDNGDIWLISLMHADGLGPSRLLLADQLERVFPRGYRVALPERSRAFAFSVELDLEDADMVDTLIQRSYSSGDRPLSPGIFEPEDLLSATPSSTT